MKQFDAMKKLPNDATIVICFDGEHWHEGWYYYKKFGWRIWNAGIWQPWDGIEKWIYRPRGKK